MYTINMFIERYYHIILYNYLSLIIIAWNAGMVIAHIYIHIYIYHDHGTHGCGGLKLWSQQVLFVHKLSHVCFSSLSLSLVLVYQSESLLKRPKIWVPKI